MIVVTTVTAVTTVTLEAIVTVENNRTPKTSSKNHKGFTKPSMRP